LTLGTILGGAVAPVIATTLYNAAGSSRLVTAYITVMSLLSFVSSLWLKETYRQELQ
jgi:hypothetical protein